MPPAALASAAQRRLPSRDRLVRYLLLGAGVGAAGYAAYRLYHSDTAAVTQRQLARVRAALAAYADAFGTGADTLRMLASDLRAFLQSDQTEVPPSLRQLARLMQSREVADTTSATMAALVRGVTGSKHSTAAAAGPAEPASAFAVAAAAASVASGSGGGGGPGALDRVLDALLSERGQGLVSVAVSMGARNLVAGFVEAQHRLAAEDAAARGAAAPPTAAADRLLGFLASRRGQRLAVLAVTAFVSSGMRTYLDQTMDINVFEELLSAMARPEHLEAVKQVVGVFARDVVGAYMAGPGASSAGAAGHLRLSASIQELLGRSGSLSGEQRAATDPAAEAAAEGDTGSPCGSSASGGWRQQAAAPPPPCAAASDIDSDVLLEQGLPAGKPGGAGAGDDSARSREGVAAPAPAPPPLPALRRVRQLARSASGASLQRDGSANLEWISAVGKEWLNVAQHPQGRTVMVELAGTAAKEAVRGASSALMERYQLQCMLAAAAALLLLAWLMQRLVGVVLG